jgi:predicted nucleotidyltransferase
MDAAERMAAAGVDPVAAVAALRAASARFAFLHGSAAAGDPGSARDVDVAAWFGGGAPAPWDVAVPARVDLLVLDTAPLELAGRVALHGLLLFDDDPPARVEWQSLFRRMWLDERPRVEATRRIALEAMRARGRR